GLRLLGSNDRPLTRHYRAIADSQDHELGQPLNDARCWRIQRPRSHHPTVEQLDPLALEAAKLDQAIVLAASEWTDHLGWDLHHVSTHIAGWRRSSGTPAPP